MSHDGRNPIILTGLLVVTTSLSRWGPIQPYITASPTSREVGFCRLAPQLAVVGRRKG